MSDYWKSFIAGCIWTALEGLAAVLVVYSGLTADPMIKAIVGAVAAVAIFAAKTLKLGFPDVAEVDDFDEVAEDKKDE